MISDNAPPVAPTGVQATALGASSIRVTWNTAADDTGVGGYEVRRDCALTGSTAATSFLDTGLSANARYSYVVSAFDVAGNRSPLSLPAVVTTATCDGSLHLEAEAFARGHDLTAGNSGHTCASAANPACFSNADLICDTPPEQTPNFGCPASRNTCASAGADPIENYMDYSDDPCMDRFSLQQMRRIRCTVEHYRSALYQPVLFYDDFETSNTNAWDVPAGS